MEGVAAELQGKLRRADDGGPDALARLYDAGWELTLAQLGGQIGAQIAETARLVAVDVLSDAA